RRVEPVAPRRAPVRRIVVTRKPQSRLGKFRAAIEQNLLMLSALLFGVGLAGLCLALYHEFNASGLFGPASTYPDNSLSEASVNKADAVGISSYPRTAPKAAPAAAPKQTLAKLSPLPLGESATNRVAKVWSYFDPKRATEPVHTASLPGAP